MPKVIQSETKGLYQETGSGFDIETADLRGAISTVGVTTISVVTAADASHTLSASAPGLVLITAALANGSVIKLPAASAANVGLYYKIVIAGKLANAAQIQLPNGGTGNFAGVVIIERCGPSGDGSARAAVVECIAITPGSSKQSLDLDAVDETFGGGIGTTLEFYYASTTEVVVTGDIKVDLDSTAIDAATATTFTATGY
jgi:hypothetical protein